MPADVLVIDDEPPMTELIKRQLEGIGYRVAVSHSGKHALELIQGWRPDLVLLDIMMPGMNGSEVCRRMREIDDMETVPIIMLTALGDIQSKQEAFGAGADDYITKPYDRTELALRVGAHLRRVEKLAEINLSRQSYTDAAWAVSDRPRRLPVISGERDATVSVIIPTLNEADCLPFVLPRIPRWVNEVILVDGDSVDGTVEIARSLLPDIRVIAQDGKGKGNALRCGFDAAQGDIVVAIDADGSNDPAEIPFFVGALLSGADFAKGTRFVQGGGTTDMPFYRVVGNWMFVVLVRILFGSTYSDLCYGFNAFWADKLKELALDVDGFEIETAMNVRALRKGLRVAEIPSFEAERVHGVAKLKPFRAGWAILKTIFREFFAHRSGRRRGGT